MRGYYYYDQQGGPAPAEPPKRKKRARRGGGLAVALFLCALGAMIGLAVLLALWRVPELPRLADGPAKGQEDPAPAGETEGPSTAIPRAPTGDGTVLTVAPATGAALSFQEIYRENIPAIVSVRAMGALGYSWGTGVVMTEDGYIITNAHVIAGCDQAEVAFQDGTVYEALLVGKDTPSDLAVLKIDCGGLTPAEFGDSEALEVGDTVLAIGNPLGEELWGTMTDGIISAINRDVNVDGYTMSLLQTTAALNQGNSGGALINEYGQVVGITNLKMGADNSLVEGLGFAIPTTTVKTVVDQLIAYGMVTGRPTMGITVTTITAARAEALDIPTGARVESVEPEGPAFGVLQPGDVITQANGYPVGSTDDLLAVKEGLAAGDVLDLTLWLSGVWLERTITLVEQAELEN